MLYHSLYLEVHTLLILFALFYLHLIIFIMFTIILRNNRELLLNYMRFLLTVRMESNSSTPTQHSVMLHVSTSRVNEELNVSDQSPEIMNNAQVSPFTPGDMQSTGMIGQYCTLLVEVTHNQPSSSISSENHPASNPRRVSSWAHPALVTPFISEISRPASSQSRFVCMYPVDVTDEQRKRTYMKTHSQHVDIDEYLPRVKIERMSQLQINTYCKRIRNSSVLQQLGEFNEDFTF